MTELRDLGPIEGREVPPPPTTPPAWSPPASSPPPPPPPPPAAPPVSPGGPPAAVPPPTGPPPPSGRALAAARDEAAQALRDIREAHRRGPTPNSRPLPAWVKRLAWVLDDAVAVPGTNGRRVGVDGFLTLIPGIGDAVGLALSMVVILAGVAAGVSYPTLLRMLLNAALESVVGLIPVVGAGFDMVYKANDRNVRLIEADLADRRRTARSSLAVLVMVLVTLAVAMFMLLAVTVLGIAVVVWLLSRLFG